MPEKRTTADRWHERTLELLKDFLLQVRKWRIATQVFGLMAVFAIAVPAQEQDPKAGDIVNPILTQYCRECHAIDPPRGDFHLKTLTLDFSDSNNRQRWLGMLEQVKSGAMPPEGKPRPASKDIQELDRWIHDRMSDVHTEGRVVLRRLNRNEYANTVRDLLKVEDDFTELLPQDTVTGGFDNAAEALHTSSFLMESYLAAADQVLDAAIANGTRPGTIQRRYDIRNEKAVAPSGSVYRHLEDGVAIFSSWVSANIQVTLWQFQTPQSGKYRFRISGYGFQTEKPVTFHVKAGPLNAQAQQRLIDYFEVPAQIPTVVEFVEQMEAEQTIRIVTDKLGAIPPQVTEVGAENYQGPGLVVQWVEVEGPLHESWPPESHRMLLGNLQQTAVRGETNRWEVVSSQPMADAERILLSFVRRAFRRPVTAEDIAPFLTRVQMKLQQGDSFEEALRLGLKSVLVSPQFLFLREKTVTLSDMPAEEPTSTYSDSAMLDDFSLASRLSYFLWSSMPDEELFRIAEQGDLRRPETLSQQVERMLKDPKSAAFTENFVGQWLSLRAIDDTTPDRMLYPEYDDILKVSMVREVLLFFDEILRNDLSLTNFVASDFTILNSRLAEHYGIPGIDGLNFRKEWLPSESHRGGVLTMAAVLKVTANGTTTSPILRGAWVLDRILGTPPPKPTMDVGAVDPDIRGATTIREQLAKHRHSTTCASCHVKIDPPGFALESFDVIGGWREYYRSIGDGPPAMVNGRTMKYRYGPPVDCADQLFDGRRFADIDEYKQLLLSDSDQLAKALAVQLVTYAIGATPSPNDTAEIEAIVDRIREQNYGLRSLIHEIVQSRIFQSK